MQGSEQVLDYFFSGKIMSIPVYQRNYEWKAENCKQLFEDLIELTKHPRKKHFFGSVIYQIDTHTEDRVIIDGQQRLTTIALLLAAIRDAINVGKAVSKDPSLIDELTDRLIKPHKGYVMLRPVENDADAYEKLILKSETTEGSSICVNYAYFLKRIEGLSSGVTVDDIYSAIGRLEIMIVRLSVEDGDDPQAVFESINSTGQSLTEGDRIRNYVLMNADAHEQNRIYSEYWRPIEKLLSDDELSNFFRDYLIMSTMVTPRKDAIYASFRSYANERKENGAYEVLLKDLLDAAGIYRQMLDSNLDHISSRASTSMYHINVDSAPSFRFSIPSIAWADQGRACAHVHTRL